MNQYGLTKITLHNSYYSNLTVSIKTDGHTNCSGTNAAGKTTMLRVLALFYGCKPSRFDARATDKKPFQEHVLPTASSLLIYDYQREDGEYCVAVYRNNNGLVYRFLKGHSRNIFFNESTAALLKEGKAATDIFTHLIKQQAEKDAISSQVTTISDYAAIIQNNVPRQRRRNHSGRNLHYLAQKYCLGTRGSDMRLMGELSYTLIKRSQMFERLKQMVVETQFNYEPPKVPKHKGNTKLNANLRSLRSFVEHEPFIRKAITQHRERLSLQNIILQHVRGIAAGRNDLASKITAEKELLQSLETQKEQAQAAYDRERETLSQELSNTQHRLKSLTTHIDKADAENDRWIEADMGTKEEEFEQLESYREREQQAKSHYNALLDNQKGLIEDRERRLNEIKSDRLNNIQKHRDRIDDLKGEIDKCKDRYETHSNEIRREYSHKEKALRTAWEDKRTPLIQRIARLETLEQNLVPTEEEMLEVASANERISETDSSIERLETELERAKVDMEAARSQRDARAGALKDRDRQLVQAKRKVEELERLCHPPEKSLLRELRNNAPGWTETIGRLIRPELLDRKNLVPEFVETQEEASFYGLILDLEKIDKTDVAHDIEALQEQLDIVQAHQRNAEDNQKSAEAQLHEACETLRQKASAHEEVDHQRRTAANTRREATHYLKRLQARHKDNLRQRREDIKNERKDQQEELDISKKDFEKSMESVGDQHGKAVNDALAIRSEEIGDLEDKIRSRESSIEAVQSEAKEKRDEVHLAYKQKMADQDVDEAALSRAKQRFDEAHTRVREVQSYQEKLFDYRSWLSRTWAEIPKQREEQHSLTEALEKMQRKLEQLQRDHRQKINTFAIQLRSTEVRIREANEVFDTATALLAQAGEAPPGEASEGTLEYLCQSIQSLLAEQQQVKSQVLNSVRQATDSIYATPESQVYDAWKLLIDDRKDRSGHEEYSEAFLLQVPEDLETLLEKSIPQIRAAQIETVKAVGSTYVDFHQKLDSLAKEVTRVSRQLKQKINTDQRIGSLSDIELVLESRIHTAIDGWEQLKLFVAEFSSWHSIMSNELPPESLEQALESVIVLIDPDTVQTKIESLVDMKIKMTESGRPTEVSSDESFEDSSSNGLSYLALIVIFVGLSRYLCPNHDIQLTWPIDELASLDPMNVSSLFTMLNNNNIWMLSAFPSTDFNLLQHFDHRYLLDRTDGAREFTGNSEISEEEIDDVLSALPLEENA